MRNKTNRHDDTVGMSEVAFLSCYICEKTKGNNKMREHTECVGSECCICDKKTNGVCKGAGDLGGGLSGG